MSPEALKSDGRYTYADYITWDDDERYELIDGVPYAMAPAPTQVHQEIGGEIFRQFANYLEGKPCKVFIAPFDVRLNADDKDDTIVQPDLLIVCDKSKLDGKCCVGAPDLVIEILSPSTARKDRLIKLNQYQKAGVREYWIVSPDEKTVQIYLLRDGHFELGEVYTPSDIAKVNIIEGCFIELQKVFS